MTSILLVLVTDTSSMSGTNTKHYQDLKSEGDTNDSSINLTDATIRKSYLELPIITFRRRGIIMINNPHFVHPCKE